MVGCFLLLPQNLLACLLARDLKSEAGNSVSRIPFKGVVAVGSLSYVLIINSIVVKSIPWPDAIAVQQLKQQSGGMLHRT